MNSILKTYRRKFVKTFIVSIFPPKKILNVFKLCVFFTQKMIKNVIFNNTKNTPVRVFIYMSSMCVQLCTVFEAAVLKFYVPW